MSRMTITAGMGRADYNASRYGGNWQVWLDQLEKRVYVRMFDGTKPTPDSELMYETTENLDYEYPAT